MVLSGCAPMTDSKDPEPVPDISISNALYGPHFIHFEMTVNTVIRTDMEVGFLIGTGATPPENPASKQGYISRTFGNSTQKRQLFLFMHDGTGYTDTDIANTFESADFLQADTNYYLHIFNDNLTTTPQAFKTMSYETLKTAGNSIAALDGLGNTDAASLTRTIERKAGEPTIVPAVIFGGNYATGTIRGSDSDIAYCARNFVSGSQRCIPNFLGLTEYLYYQDGNTIDYVTLLVHPNNHTEHNLWSVLTGITELYKLQISTISR
ncbi:hypothetical protein P0082_09360 [Candidatus Haliotispira prima]|uniref:Uncharacterized protein n=1 Tax=Candidatus Haliotispira prima TaxID=3034016 RepID=A0ABY8MHL3_9SPIO|nr:hypothetical protein P0082_09360 [Candidatus Haliotispira prima]